ncbi:MAG: NUDIX domain-containing protein [Chloroflexota bacterium]|nr:NUDIX domain-containing protein [Chloroflexota bacterium]
MATQSSSVVVFNDKQEILLVLREDARVWALPAGGLESSETFEQAAIREVREETGYNIELERLVGKYWRPQYPKGGDRMQVFVGKAISGDISEHDWESIAVRWFPLDALPKRLFRFSREHIQDACANSREPFERAQKFSRMQAMLMGWFFALRKIRNLVLRRS